ncbi:ankyrin repeat and SOCS box protein 13-like isoform X1 [Lates japonicus]|uniref:Ankyrin repeat and SOCS box protein 13-like isoform X1 n=1 Tax=Lates japonicus TaxID=270547 RepID=A0AAD3M688_LATJO|nr:ankyrin repeat and SOCS box protein 13-like isoform X1 [Lates japonicus]
MEVTAARRSFLCDIGFWADRTALHEAAFHGRVLQLKQLIESGASVNMVTVDNITPLHEACIQAHVKCAQLLLEAGAQVDVRTIHGSTPLCNACASGSLECAKLLLDYGAKVNPSLTALTASPLHEACINGNTLAAIREGSTSHIPLDVFTANDTFTFLSGNVDVVRLMIASGAELEAYDVHFGPPLHITCAKGYVHCVRELLIAGANVNSVKFHETALHHAARVHMVDLIELLVEFGANVYASDNLGRKPIDYTTPASPSHTCLRFYESNPLSLQQLCRITVRMRLGTRASEVIGQLNISHRIHNYLQYCDHPTSLQTDT